MKIWKLKKDRGVEMESRWSGARLEDDNKAAWRWKWMDGDRWMKEEEKGEKESKMRRNIKKYTQNKPPKQHSSKVCFSLYIFRQERISRRPLMTSSSTTWYSESLPRVNGAWHLHTARDNVRDLLVLRCTLAACISTTDNCSRWGREKEAAALNGLWALPNAG